MMNKKKKKEAATIRNRFSFLFVQKFLSFINIYILQTWIHNRLHFGVSTDSKKHGVGYVSTFFEGLERYINNVKRAKI